MSDDIEKTVAARKSRKKASDRYLPQLRSIASNYFKYSADEIAIADDDQDYRNATDLVLPNGQRIACKVRTAGIRLLVPNEFALRHDPNGRYASEWQKVQKGYVRYLLYAYSNEAETCLTHYRLIDLEIVLAAARDGFAKCWAPTEKHITERDVHFISFDGSSIRRGYGQLLLDSGVLASAA